MMEEQTHITQLTRKKKERAPTPEERELITEHFRTEYLRTIQLLNRARVLEFFPELNALGIRDEDGRPYPVPTFEEVLAMCEDKWGAIIQEWNEGFQKLQLTPFALPLNVLASKIGDELRSRFQKNQLRYPGSNFHVRELHYNDLVHFSDFLETGLSSQDFLNSIHYYPYDLNSETADRHYPKATWLNIFQNNSRQLAPGWSVCILESDEAGIRRRQHMTTISEDLPSRPTNQINQYLEMLKTEGSRYQTGLTVEDCFTEFLLQLYETGEVTYDGTNGRVLTFGTRLSEPLVIAWSRSLGQIVCDEYLPLDFLALPRTALRLNSPHSH